MLHNVDGLKRTMILIFALLETIDDFFLY
jgi:hypothetical protein